MTLICTKNTSQKFKGEGGRGNGERESRQTSKNGFLNRILRGDKFFIHGDSNGLNRVTNTDAKKYNFSPNKIFRLRLFLIPLIRTQYIQCKLGFQNIMYECRPTSIDSDTNVHLWCTLRLSTRSENDCHVKSCKLFKSMVQYL